MSLGFGRRRGTYVDVTELPAVDPLSGDELAHFELLDLVYRSLCALLYNYVPTSGHPGGSISSGRFVAGILFDALEYDLSDPDRGDADLVSYAAGHKAMGLYSMWALRDEIVRQADPGLLPGDPTLRLGLEDLLGFRRNPVTSTPLFKSFKAKALDGHPTPATPFLRLSTGASGVGVASSIGLAYGARDAYGGNAPRVHIVEGEGGLTPGRVAEAVAAAGTASLDNIVLHLDWNQASIDTNRVCRDGDEPGDYVQWNPQEFFYLHDWNVLFVPDGTDFQQVMRAQRQAAALETTQPTAIIYRTTKGWQYGIEGRQSHGAGHKLCSDGFYQALSALTVRAQATLPSCEGTRCQGAGGEAVREQCFWEALLEVRAFLGRSGGAVKALAGRLRKARSRLDERRRAPREGAPRVEAVYELAREQGATPPPALLLSPGGATTLREELGRALGHYNEVSGGALFVAAADLLGSTSVSTGAKAFPGGYWNTATNPGSRTLSMGGICEDGMSGVLAGLSSFGHHIGVGSSYGAFIAPLGHIAARLHAIGGQSRHAIVPDDPYRTMILICAHAGLKTGEDGPTHADPQPLQLLQEGFPRGTAITLTPWEPQEIWTLLAAALARRPAVIAPFVTRPSEKVLDRQALGLASPEAAATGVYALRRARGQGDGVLVLQESAVTYAFVEEALPRLQDEGVDLWIYSVSSAELFDLLPRDQQEEIFPEEKGREAMGITGFTLPTMYRWVRSDLGREMTVHPFQKGHFLGSGQGHMVMAEAGLDGESLYHAVRRFLDRRARTRV